MITNILIGVVLMFLLEHFTRLKKFKKYIKSQPKSFEDFGLWERVIGILFWPILLGIFLYNFFKELIK